MAKFDIKKWALFGAMYGVVSGFVLFLVATILGSIVVGVIDGVTLGIAFLIAVVVAGVISWSLLGLLYHFILEKSIKKYSVLIQLVILSIASAIGWKLIPTGSIVGGYDWLFTIVSAGLSGVVVFYISNFFKIKIPMEKGG